MTDANIKKVLSQVQLQIYNETAEAGDAVRIPLSTLL